jgi:tripartite-type tricarboxylate transporter receptor subunit TctC
VPADAPYNNLKEFIAASKQGLGFHWATAGTGSTPHFVSGILETKYGAKLDVVPYKSGSESITAVLGKQVEATSEASIVALPYIKSGKLKGLADTWTARISAYPQLSTAVEQGFPDMQIAHWCGVHAPAGTPADILDKMAAAIDAAMKDPVTVEHLKNIGIEPVGGTRASFTKFVADERARLGAVVTATGMKDE